MATKKYVPRLYEFYQSEIVKDLQKEFGYKNIMQVPKLKKISINLGMGEAKNDHKLLDEAIATLTALSGQKASIRRSKKSISNFKLRKGVPIAAKVTLRGARMYDFLDRFISLAIPRMRDFKGVPDRSFDGRGNYTIGVKDQLIFPEVDYNKVTRAMGMNITFCTSANTDLEAKALLKGFGMPFKK